MVSPIGNRRHDIAALTHPEPRSGRVAGGRPPKGNKGPSKRVWRLGRRNGIPLWGCRARPVPGNTPRQSGAQRRPRGAQPARAGRRWPTAAGCRGQSIRPRFVGTTTPEPVDSLEDPSSSRSAEKSGSVFLNMVDLTGRRSIDVLVSDAVGAGPGPVRNPHPEWSPAHGGVEPRPGPRACAPRRRLVPSAGRPLRGASPQRCATG